MGIGADSQLHAIVLRHLRPGGLFGGQRWLVQRWLNECLSLVLVGLVVVVVVVVRITVCEFVATRLDNLLAEKEDHIGHHPSPKPFLSRLRGVAWLCLGSHLQVEEAVTQVLKPKHADGRETNRTAAEGQHLGEDGDGGAAALVDVIVE